MSITPYTFDLEPGQTKHQTFGEANFIFVDQADRTIEVLIDGGWQSLRRGSKFISKNGLFDRFDIRNPDPDLPVRVVMFIGTDQVENLIIEGDITVTPGIRRADGTLVDDRRHDISVQILPDLSKTGVVVAAGTDLAVLAPDSVYDTFMNMWVEGDRIQYMATDSAYSPAFRLFSLDSDLNVVNTQTLSAALSSAISRFGNLIVYWPEAGGYVWTKTDGRLYRFNTATQDGEVFGTLPKAPQAMQVMDGKLVVAYDPGPRQVYQNGCFVVYDNALNEVASYGNAGFIDQGSNNTWYAQRLFYDPINETWTISDSGSTDVYQVSKDFSTFISSRGVIPGFPTGNSGGEWGQYLIIGKVIYGVNWSGNDDRGLRKVQYIEVTQNIPSVAIPGRCSNPLLRRDVGDRYTAANITADALNGQVTVSGELIKAVLEIYYGSLLLPDFEYLDHVYSLTIDKPAGLSLPKTVRTSGLSFRAAKIPDQFTAVFPSRVTLTVDDQLEFTKTLEN